MQIIIIVSIRIWISAVCCRRPKTCWIHRNTGANTKFIYCKIEEELGQDHCAHIIRLPTVFVRCQYAKHTCHGTPRTQVLKIEPLDYSFIEKPNNTLSTYMFTACLRTHVILRPSGSPFPARTHDEQHFIHSFKRKQIKWY